MVYRKDWAQSQTGGQGFARTMKTLGRRVNVSATDDVTGNTVGAFTVPPGFVVTGILWCRQRSPRAWRSRSAMPAAPTATHDGRGVGDQHDAGGGWPAVQGPDRDRDHHHDRHPGSGQRRRHARHVSDRLHRQLGYRNREPGNKQTAVR